MTCTLKELEDNMASLRAKEAAPAAEMPAYTIPAAAVSHCAQLLWLALCRLKELADNMVSLLAEDAVLATAHTNCDNAYVVRGTVVSLAG
jgi:hypothetical protein